MRRPLIIAEQARDARGLLGRIIAFIMARETLADNRRALEALEVGPVDCVLDAGCGHGRGVALAAARAAHVSGADPSALMGRIARQRNRRALMEGRVDIATCAAERLPYRGGYFDKVFCVHVAYFWADLAPALAELARVLKPGGRLAMIVRTSDDTKAVAAFPEEVYRFPPFTALLGAADAAGFTLSSVPPSAEERERGAVLLVWSRA